MEVHRAVGTLGVVTGLSEAAIAARAAGVNDEAALADAYVALVDVLAGHEASTELLGEKLAVLRRFEGGDGLVDQVTAAHTALDR
jgi:hypothetical protein